MKIYAQILGTATGDSCPSVLIFFDNKRYLFDCGEGTQRFCTEFKVKLSKLANVFVTEVAPDAVGGLPGMMLTLADIGHSHLNIFGPKNLLNYLVSLRYFVQRNTLKINIEEFEDAAQSATSEEAAPPTKIDPSNPLAQIGKDFFKDENLTVEAVAINIPQDNKQQRALLAKLKDEQQQQQPTTCDGEQDDFCCSRNGRPSKKSRYTCVANNNNDTNNSDIDDTDNDSEHRLHHDKQPMRRQENQQPLPSTYMFPTEPDFEDPERFAADKTPEGINNIQRRRRQQAKELEQAVKNIPPPSLDKHVLCYICRTADVPGKFDPKKAKELGIPAGPLFGKLCKGETVITPAGKEVKPSDVIGPSERGPAIVIIRCPTTEYVHTLVNHPKWVPYFDNAPGQGTGPTNVACIVHAAPESVMRSEEYINFMRKFGKKCQHIVINKEVSPQRPIFLSQTIHYFKLNMINSNIFDNIPFYEDDKDQSKRFKTLNLHKDLKVVAGDNLMKFTLGPLKSIGLDTSDPGVPKVDPQELVAQVEQDTNLQEKIKEYKAKISEEHVSADAEMRKHELMLKALPNGRQEAEISFLGTGSAIPSKYRNVSSIYLHMFARGGVIMDCGEGTYGQLFRRYGAQTDAILANLKCIWISHMHADHHCGLPKLLIERQRAIKKILSAAANNNNNNSNNEENTFGDDEKYKLMLVAPTAMRKFLAEYVECAVGNEESADLHLNFEFIDCNQIIETNNRISNFLLNTLGFSVFHNVRVIHCKDSYGLIMQHTNGWKIVYSGDTRPCPALVEAGKGATVMIHEATFEDSMVQEAIAKRHSTTQEAIKSGVDMNAYRILLTHFSQRYPKIPMFDSSYTECTCVAFDLMSVNLQDLPHLPHLLPSLHCLFSEELETLSGRAGAGDEEEDDAVEASLTETTGNNNNNNRKKAAAGAEKQQQQQGDKKKQQQQQKKGKVQQQQQQQDKSIGH